MRMISDKIELRLSFLFPVTLSVFLNLKIWSVVMTCTAARAPADTPPSGPASPPADTPAEAPGHTPPRAAAGSCCEGRSHRLASAQFCNTHRQIGGDPWPGYCTCTAAWAHWSTAPGPPPGTLSWGSPRTPRWSRSRTPSCSPAGTACSALAGTHCAARAGKLTSAESCNLACWLFCSLRGPAENNWLVTCQHCTSSLPSTICTLTQYNNTCSLADYKHLKLFCNNLHSWQCSVKSGSAGCWRHTMVSALPSSWLSYNRKI